MHGKQYFKTKKYFNPESHNPNNHRRSCVSVFFLSGKQ